MSAEKNNKEAKRWLKTAMDDLDTARVLQENSKFAHSCFHSQQASEKALKALWYFIDEDPWGHSVKKLIDDLKQVNAKYHDLLAATAEDARILDRYYIPTRYPNGLPEMTPDDAFTEKDAMDCLARADKILTVIRNHIK